MKDYFTEEALRLESEAEKYGLLKYFDIYMCNFCFTEEDFKTESAKIKEWLKAHKDYFILCEDIEIYKESSDYLNASESAWVYFLTNFLN